MNIFYRISNNSYKKNRLPHATKEHCLDNFLSVFKKYNINLIADNVTEPSLLEFIKSKQSDKFKIEYTSLGNGQCFKHCLHRACNELNDGIVYLVEDDYLHLPNSDKLLMEGLELASYLTLYNHPDKFINAENGGNPQVSEGGEITRVVATKSSVWKLTNSTTCTFATHINVLKEDINIWDKYLYDSYPKDYAAFCELIQINGRSLLSPIPSLSTHAEIEWLAPHIDWSKV